MEQDSLNGLEIAVVGMGCRVPGARNTEEFWRNLVAGVESVSLLTKEELISLGHVHPAELSHPEYVRSRGILQGADLFDAAFFGMSPREAELTDPQQRVFLELAWEAMENAGYAPGTALAQVGVFAGMGTNTYYLFNLAGVRETLEGAAGYQAVLWNEKDFLATHVSYKLDLRGPSISVQTGCSSSLVAVRLACLSLISGECDMALAGGVSIPSPQHRGYVYQQGGILSPDGHCRAFDAEAKGTVSGSGAGIVVLKRLEDAVADRDTIHAVIKGCAINNDGALKIGYTAPGMEGQVSVIQAAQQAAGVHPETISYIEAHGTGTELGDPVEVAALTEAFRAGTSKKNYCAIGSVKTNLGHLDAAAGVVGLIKVVLMLKNKTMPPSLHFKNPNPALNLGDSPFYVNASLRDWKSEQPRRAAVSSLGVGGTNAHVIVEESSSRPRKIKTAKVRLMVMSARTGEALQAMNANMAQELALTKEDISDVAYTLQTGRKNFACRQAFVCTDIQGAIEVLTSGDSSKLMTVKTDQRDSSAVFLFPGQGSQYVNMALGIYDKDPGFRATVEACCEILKPHLGFDLRGLLYPGPEHADAASRKLAETAVTQPALFVIEYSLAKLLVRWGIAPKAMLGNSIGEYVAACLAGVFTLEDALKLVAVRGRLMQSAPRGSMLAVGLSEENVVPRLDGELSLAAVNGERLCIVAGSTKAVDQLAATLAKDDIYCQRLHTSHAFHSHMMDTVEEPFAREVKKMRLHAPALPFYSCVTGELITAEAAKDYRYWARQMRAMVRLAPAIQEIANNQSYAPVEVGPGRATGNLFKQLGRNAIACLRRPNEKKEDGVSLLEAVGQLWIAGVKIDWTALSGEEDLYRVPLPPYPFEHKRYWIDPPRKQAPSSATAPDRNDRTHLNARAATETRKDMDHDLQYAGNDSTTAASDELERLILQQLELISDQLNLLPAQD